MAAEDRAGKWRKVLIIIVGVLVFLMLLIGFFAGLSNLKKFFTWLLVGMLIISILFSLAYVFWLIFIKKEYKDIPASYKKKLIQTAKLMKNDVLGNLYLSGDEKHNRLNLGKYTYLRMQLPKQTVQYIDKRERGDFGELTTPKQVVTATPVAIDCFVLLKKGLMERMFGEPVFILVRPDDHNYSSIFNDVTISGFNLVPLDSQFYTIDRRNLDTDIIKGMSIIYQKEVVDEIFKSLDRMVKMSIGLDQDFQKNKEKALQFDIPQINTGDKN